MYSWVLLDWDGCIADTLGLWVKAYEKVLPKHGIHASPEDIWKKLCIGNVPKQFAVADIAQCRQDIGEAAAELFQDVLLYENVKSTLEAVTNHAKLAIISNTRSHLLHPVLKRHQLDNVFASIVTQEDVAKPKPHPEGLFKTMESLGADPQRTLFVGDSDKDLEVARHGGIDSALFYPSQHEGLYDFERLQTYEPTHVLRNFQELEQLVR
jgi:HAD superfamily hydrolase (TIGR01549 family)